MEIAYFPPASTAPFLVILPLILAVHLAAENIDHISQPILHLCYVTKFWPMRLKHRKCVQIPGSVPGECVCPSPACPPGFQAL